MESPSSQRPLRFGVFEVDLHAAELRKNGVRLKLQEQPFQVLAMLLESAGEVVTREELRARLWPADTFVDYDHSLGIAVNKIREVLGDSADNPRFIETLPRRGYRFIVPVHGANLAMEGFAQAEGRRRLRLVWIAPAIAVFLALLFGLNFQSWRRWLSGNSDPTQIRSLVVLPLENLSGDLSQEYFADGITDALTTDLAQLGSILVISRTSAMQYKNKNKALREIARELNVDAVVEGSVVRSGEQVRISAQLIEAKNDRHLWAQNYERNLSNVVALQSEVARAIAAEIRIKLTPKQQERLTRTHTVDPQAYEAYLKGRFFWNKRTEASLWRSIEFFQEAIQKDPNYGPPYGGIAEAYVALGFFGGLLPRDAFSRSKAAARKALEIDDSLSEAHNALAATLFDYDWDWPGAEKEYRRAIELNPSYGMAHQWYGVFLNAMSRPEWESEMRKAHDVDPLSLLSNAGGYNQSVENERKTLEMDPNFAFAYLRLSAAYEARGMYEEAIAAARKATALSEDSPHYLGKLGQLYALAGRRNEAQETLQTMAKLSKRRYVSPYSVALVYIGLGENDRAFDWLNKAYAERTPPLVLLKTAGGLGKIRSDPRFAELERRIGLPR